MAAKTSQLAPDPLIAEARARWVMCDEAEDLQRKIILEAKQFRAGDQWPDAIKIARRGGNAIQGLPPQPPRPCLVIDRLSQPVRQISNAIKTADFTFTVLPNSKGADEATADIYRGYMRRVQNQSRDDSPVEWAADQAVEGGIGWFRLRTKFVHEHWDGDPNDPAIFDQELCLERITNNLTVYCDPYAMRPTRSDALFMFVTQDLNRDEFERRWPKADFRGLQAFEATGDAPQSWVNTDSIRIAEYWRIVYQERPFIWLDNGTVREGTAAKGAKGVKMTRIMRVPVVKGSIINACQELEKMDWAGSHIPLIPVLGEELNIDGKVRLRGVIEGAMDPQRMVNYTFSGAIEIFALGPKNAPIVPASAVANYQNIWKSRTWQNWSYLPIDVFDTQGRPIPPPVFNPTEPPIQAAVALMNVSEEAIKATTSTFDPSLGQTNPMQQSGVAIQSLQNQGDLATSNYPDNVRRALIYAGEQMAEVIPKITRVGQVLHIIGQDEKPKQIIAGQVFNYGGINGTPKTQQPQPSPDVTPEAAALSQGLHQFFDLNNGTYHVTVDMAKESATRLEEGRAALAQLIPRLPPEMAAVLTPEYIENLSMPDAHKMADLARQALPPNLQQPKDGQQNPQVMQLQQQIQQLQQALQGKQAEKQAEMHGQMQIEQMKAQANFQQEVQLQRMKNDAAITIARINASKDADKSLIQAQEEQAATGLQIAHEQREAEKDRAHDVGMAAMDHVHASLQDAAQHQQTLQQVAVGGAIKSQQQADAAQLQTQQGSQPPPQQQPQPQPQQGGPPQ